MFCLGLHKQDKIIPCKMSLSPHLAEQFKTIQWFPCIMHVYALCGIGQPKGSQLDTHNKGHRMGWDYAVYEPVFFNLYILYSDSIFLLCDPWCSKKVSVTYKFTSRVFLPLQLWNGPQFTTVCYQWKDACSPRCTFVC